MSDALTSTVPRTYVCGVRVDLLYTEATLRRIGEAIELGRRESVVFVNAHCVNVASRDSDYANAIRGASVVLNDGIGVRLAARLKGVKIAENMCGTDFLPRLFAYSAARGYSVFLYGGKPGVAEAAAASIEQRWPGTHIVGVSHGYVDGKGQEALLDRMQALKVDIVVVALGVPLQENWVQSKFPLSGAKVAIAVGAYLDFESGRIPRAPLWVRRVGLEWLFRLMVEPRRLFRRYVLGNVEFIGRVVVDVALGRGQPSAR